MLHSKLHAVQRPRIIFDKVAGYIRKYDGAKYLALFNSDEKFDRIFDKIIHLILLKSNLSDVYCHKYMKNQNGFR